VIGNINLLSYLKLKGKIFSFFHPPPRLKYLGLIFYLFIFNLLLCFFLIFPVPK